MTSQGEGFGGRRTGRVRVREPAAHREEDDSPTTTPQLGVAPATISPDPTERALIRGLNPVNGHGEGASHTLDAGHFDRCVVPFGDPLRQRQSEPRPLCRDGAADIRPVERLEQVRTRIGGECPGPLSATARDATRSPRVTATSTRPSSGLNLMALSSRISRSRWSHPASPTTVTSSGALQVSEMRLSAATGSICSATDVARRTRSTGARASTMSPDSARASVRM